MNSKTCSGKGWKGRMPRVIAYCKYLTKAGDSFDSLALDFYDDEGKAGEIARFNPNLTDVLLFEAGELVNIPIFSDDDPPESLAPWRRN